MKRVIWVVAKSERGQVLAEGSLPLPSLECLKGYLKAALPEAPAVWIDEATGTGFVTRPTGDGQLLLATIDFVSLAPDEVARMNEPF